MSKTIHMKSFYICFEGTDGVGKTTQCDKLVKYLQLKGYKVLHTKEPGTQHLPVTIELRDLMLNIKYQENMIAVKEVISNLLKTPNELTENAIAFMNFILRSTSNTILPIIREFIGQAIRSIHIEKLIYPALKNNEYDFIIQDRGILSGLAYGAACGNDINLLKKIATKVSLKEKQEDIYKIYNKVIYLKGNVKKNLENAIICKSEFKEGDFIESQGTTLMDKVNSNMLELHKKFNTYIINVDGRDIEKIHDECIMLIQLQIDTHK